MIVTIDIKHNEISNIFIFIIYLENCFFAREDKSNKFFNFLGTLKLLVNSSI